MEKYLILILLSCVGINGENTPILRGTWKRSCRNDTVEGEFVRATCRRKDGSWIETSLNLSDCTERIQSNFHGESVKNYFLYNKDGNLYCRSTPW